MPSLGKLKPQFLKFVARPAGVGDREISEARPVYIADLPTAGDTAALEARIDALEARVLALETATP